MRPLFLFFSEKLRALIECGHYSSATYNRRNRVNEKIFTKNVKNGVLQVSMKSYLYICCFLSKSTSIFVQDIRWISLSEGTEVTNRVPAVNDYGFGSVRVLKTL